MVNALTPRNYKGLLTRRGAIALQLFLVLLLPLSRTTSASGFWSRIFNPPPPPPREGVPRGEGICFVAPFTTSNTAMVLSDRPTLTWQSPSGQTTRIAINRAGDSENRTFYAISEDNIVKLDSPTSSSTYQLTLDQPLEHGITYEWRIYRPLRNMDLGNIDEPVSQRGRFRLLAPEAAAPIREELAQLEAHIAEQDMSEEEAAIARVNFFAAEQLWAETWQVLLAVSDPSPELEAAIANTLVDLCALPHENDTSFIK